MDFLSTARYSGFTEAELKVIFNSCLDEPFEPAEMRRLRPLGFVNQVQLAMNREEPRGMSMAEPLTGLAAIPEDSPLRIGVVGVATPSSPPPASLGGKRGRRESWGSTSEEFQPEPAAPFASFLQPTSRRVARLKRKRQRRAARTSLPAGAAAGVPASASAGVQSGDPASIQSVIQPASSPLIQSMSSPVSSPVHPASSPVQPPASSPVQPASSPVVQPASQPVIQPASQPVQQPA
ncbi:transcriptional regulatory protein AlgP-like isoform X2 [Triplophysa rosa]|uniref:transcriptional regulatory protein AlgP-like isoform X2 n=1 Tax=Triplophysa rosa TaxID=992332 RepID=UPI002545E10A|nr:transcriptional regulatory protein AlgP-like isoform X2 [Triplophysa rosa]